MEAAVGAVAYQAQREFASAEGGWRAVDRCVPIVKAVLDAEAVAGFVDAAFDDFGRIGQADPDAA